MKTAHLAEAQLAEWIDRFGQCRIAVLGDFFLDKYLDVDPARQEVSLETGKPAHQVVRVRCSPGAAGTVVGNLAALGAGQLHAIGMTGDDGEGYDLRQALQRIGCRTAHLHTTADRRTPTYLKPRDTTARGLAGEHSRYDTKNRQNTATDMQEKIVASLDALLADVDAVVVLDQVEEPECGVVTRAVREALADRARRLADVIFWADSRRRIRQFHSLIIKPNQFEAVGLSDPPPDAVVDRQQLVRAAADLRQKNGAPIVLTRGQVGTLVSDPEWTEVPGVFVPGEVDTTGAGDSVTAGTVLALCAGAPLPQAAVVGNLVASITIQQLATTGIARPDQLPERLALWRKQTEEKKHG